MKILATIDLDGTAPERVRAILAALPRLRVRQGDQPLLRVDGRTFPIMLMGGIAPFAHATSPLVREVAGPDRLPLVVAERLLANVRIELEEAGVSYADGTGAVHIEVPGFFLHVEPRLGGRDGVLPPPRGLGAVAVRLIQVLLLEPAREWTVVDLAQAGGTSVGQAHNVLTRLDEEGFIAELRDGRTRRRRITNPTDLLDWLARVPAARKIHRRLTTYLYAPDPDALLTRLSHNAHNATIPWAVTGAAGAHAMGVKAVTALPIVTVRVAAKPGLNEAAKALGLEPVDSGPNVVLLADVGDVGTRGALFNGPVAIAPAVRIWLDMLGEPRGEDAAALFREAVIGY